MHISKGQKINNKRVLKQYNGTNQKRTWHFENLDIFCDYVGFKKIELENSFIMKKN
jgi:hypothetical protein